MKKYKLNIDKINHSEETAAKIRRVLMQTKNRPLCLLFIAIYTNQPLTSSEITSILNSKLGLIFDRNATNNQIRRCVEFGLIARRTPGADESDNIQKTINKKHDEFLKTIPSPFTKRFDKVNYYYVTSFGEELIPFVGQKILGVEVKLNEDSD